MISAIAARKAASAAQHSQNDQPIATKQVVSPSQESDTPTFKRKSSSQKTRVDKKKLKRSQPARKTLHSRDAFVDQDEVIVVDSGDESDEDMSMLEDSDHNIVSQIIRTTPDERAWSPSRPNEDSSDESAQEGEDGMDELDVSSLFPKGANPLESEPDVDRLLSTFEPSLGENIFYLTTEEQHSFGLSSCGTIIILDAKDSLCLLGTCELIVLHGSISIMGTNLSASHEKHAIYAPRSSPLPIIKTSNKLGGSVLTKDTLSSRLKDIPHSRTVILLQELRTGVEGLGRICRTFEGVFEPSKWQRSTTIEPFEIPGLYMVTRQSKEIHPFSLSMSWSGAIERLSSVNGGIYLVKGPKKCGKSTFARTLMNHLLGSYRRVAFLECDLGQSEFTPGGMVSLNVVSSPVFGPPHTHPTLPNFAHFIGSTTPRSSPDHYLDAISALIQSYRLDIQSPNIEMADDGDSRASDLIPLVVNTMGWAKGLGADLTLKIQDMLEPTDIFDIQAPVQEHTHFAPSATPLFSQRSRYDAYQQGSVMDECTARVHELQPVVSSSSAAGYTPADHRALSILSYFHALFPHETVPSELDQVTARSWNTSMPLCAIPPYEVDCMMAFDSVVLTGAGSEDVVDIEIGRVLNGAIVGLVSYEPGTAETKSISALGIPYARFQEPPLPASSNCVGIGLIRGVSQPFSTAPACFNTHIHILTPLADPLLAQGRILVKGEMELPIWGMLDFRNFNEGKGVDPGDVAGVERDKVPYLQWGKAPDGVIGGDKRRVRRNLMRRGQM
ncbi:hypothetical protein B0H34DRAFT_668226 [Crassisporium funariophilum]|nr:hypothetical protein B0H34DRAFT_668226 [Crassisporium funariophilum]